MSDQIKTILQAIEFIERHIQEPISVGDIADEVGYSPFHFIRVFNALVHHTPYDYLIRRRLSASVSDLISSRRRLIDIALDFGFSNQETYSRMFRKMFHVSPSDCRRTRDVSPWQLFPAKEREDLQFVSRIGFQRPTILEYKPIFLCGLMMAVEADSYLEPSQRWKRKQELLKVGGINADSKIYEKIYSVDHGWKRIYSFIGVEQSDLKSVPQVFTSSNIPEGMYAGIKCGFQEHHAALRYLCSSWIAKQNCRVNWNMEIFIDEGEKEDRRILIPIENLPFAN